MAKPFETFHTNRSITYWLNQFSPEGIEFIKKSALLIFYHRPNESSSKVNYIQVKEIGSYINKIKNQIELNSIELNDIRSKLSKDVPRLTKLWNDNYRTVIRHG